MGYILGALPFAVIVSKLKGIDIMKVGTCNPGAANVFREVGKVPGIFTWLGDTLKGVLAMLIAHRLMHLHLFFVALVGIAAVVGHCWSIFIGFKGGKGVATSGAVFFYLVPKFFPIGVVAYFLTQKIAPRSATFVIATFAICFGLILFMYREIWQWLLPALLIFLLVGILANLDTIREIKERRRK